MTFSALVAQRIEQLPSKQWVVGSIPARGTIFTLKFCIFAPYLPHTSCKSLFYVLSYVVTCQKEWSRHEKRKYMEKSKENE